MTSKTRMSQPRKSKRQSKSPKKYVDNDYFLLMTKDIPLNEHFFALWDENFSEEEEFEKPEEDNDYIYESDFESDGGNESENESGYEYEDEDENEQGEE